MPVQTNIQICFVTLPLPPGINRSYRIVKIGRTHRLSATAVLEAFKLQARVMLNQQSSQIDWELVQQIAQSKKKTPLGMELTFFYPTLWLHDIDGGVKSVQDALFKHLDLNDNQIIDLHVQKRVDKDNPRCEAKLFVVEGV